MQFNRGKLNMSLRVSLEDYTLLTTALKAYKHNAEYRQLHERLEHQAAEQGVQTSGLKGRKVKRCPVTA